MSQKIGAAEIGSICRRIASFTNVSGRSSKARVMTHGPSPGGNGSGGISAAVKILSRRHDLQRSATRLVAGLAFALAGCGDDAKLPDVPTDPSLFIGSWRASVGSFNCPMLNPMPVPLDGETIAVAAAADAPIQATVRGCVVKFDISGLKATARSPQTCRPMFMVGNITVPADLAISSGSFVVAKLPGAGEQATGVLQLSGMAMFAGLSSMCEATANVNKQP